MTNTNVDTKCPHCEEEMKSWTFPIDANWGTEPHLVCFNDKCDYFVRGWEHMMTNFEKKSSYRHRLDPKTGQTGPLPVWSMDALKDRIIE